MIITEFFSKSHWFIYYIKNFVPNIYTLWNDLNRKAINVFFILQDEINKLIEGKHMIKTTQVINDVSGSIILFFGLIMGIILIVRYKESGSKIMLKFGITCIFIGLIYLVFFLRIITYFVPIPLLYAKAPPFNSYPFLCLATYAWIGPAVLAATYIGTELMIPRQ
jgi:hypothetical protein